MRSGLKDLPILYLAIGDLWPTLILAVGVDEGRCENAVEPGLEIGSWFELVEGVEGLCVSILNKIFSILRILRITKSCTVERAGEDQRVAFETLFALARTLASAVC